MDPKISAGPPSGPHIFDESNIIDDEQPSLIITEQKCQYPWNFGLQIFYKNRKNSSKTDVFVIYFDT